MWDVIKRLTGDHPKLQEGFTHVCVCELKDGLVCNTFMKLTRKAKKEATRASA